MRRLLVPGTIAVLGAALIALLAFGLTQQSSSRSLDDAVAAGGRPVAPVAALPRLDATGRSSLSAYRGHVVVLNFWASWCVPCQTEAPLLEDTQRTLARTGRGTVLGVTYDDASPDSSAFVTTHHLTYPELRDVNGDYAHRFGTDQLPETFVIDRSGRIAAISRGEVSAPWLTHAVARAEADRT